MVWVFVGSVACLFCYVMGYVIGEFRGIEKVKLAREEMEIDEEDDGKELKIRVKSEENDSEEN